MKRLSDVEVESNVTGIVKEILAGEGAIVAVNIPIVMIEEDIP
ncbi:MAG: biotin/lipoyl-containing protein [Clostridiales bacterium]|nr:biotin/lipoyl-containing protein [Clostridiales bacterium]